MNLFPLDPTGISPNNLIIDEVQVISPPLEITDASFVVPRVTPFFKEGLRVKQGVRTLIENVDYQLIFRSIALSTHFERELFAGIMFINRQFSGSIRIDYQVLGGDFQNDDYGLLEQISRHIGAVRWVSYDQLVGLPAGFPPAYHQHDIETDLVNMGDVVTATEQIAIALALNPGNIGELSQRLDNHTSSALPVHSPSQVGLSNIENLKVATLSEIKSKKRLYVTGDNLVTFVDQKIRNIIAPDTGTGDGTLATTITQLQTDLGLLQQSDTAQNTNIGKLQTDVAALTQNGGGTAGPNYDTQITAINNRITTMQQQVTALLNSRVFKIPVGGLFETTVTYRNGAAVTNAMGYGEWEEWGSGRVTVGLWTGLTWTSSIGGTSGSFDHLLTKDEMPWHKHSQDNIHDKFSAMAGPANLATVTSSDYRGGHQELGVAGIENHKWDVMRETYQGNNRRHNITQPSITVGRWRRTS